MRFEQITNENEPAVGSIYPGDQAKYWVHYNWYWKENSRKRKDIDARLIYVEQQEEPVGFIAYGQYYEDEDLTRPLKGCYEIIHLVIDSSQQRRGYGRAATLLALALLKAKPDCEQIVIAHHPDNTPARQLYLSLGFEEWGRTNYDGDPLLHLLSLP